MYPDVCIYSIYTLLVRIEDDVAFVAVKRERNGFNDGGMQLKGGKMEGRTGCVFTTVIVVVTIIISTSGVGQSRAEEEEWEEEEEVDRRRRGRSCCRLE